MDKKIRVLAIAPYEGLRAEIIRSAGGFSDIELVDVQVGNLEEGAALVAAYEPSAYDAVLSRGGTTLYIEKVTDKPVFEIPLTYPDLLNIFKLVENYNGRILILCYPNIRSDVDNLCAILNLRYDIDDIFSWSDAEEKVRNAQQAGYSMIIGDAVSIAYTGKYQLQSMLLVSGRSSVQSAFRNILKTYRSFNGMQREYQLLKRYVNSLQGHFIALDNQGRPLFNAASAPETIVNLCRQQLPRLRRDMTSFGLYACAENYLELVGRKTTEPHARRISEDIYFFTVTESRFGRGKAGRYHGTASFSRAKLLADEAVSGSFHNNVSAALMQRYDNIIASSLSLLITGEPGTEKHVLANQIFLKRAGEQDLLYAVDCSEMTYKLLISAGK